MSDFTHDGTSLNHTAAYDADLYDHDRHDNQIVALYETDTQARTARDVLLKAGFSASAVQVVGRDAGTASTGMIEPGHAAAADEGIWGSIKSLFVPDEERTTYNTAIAHGHAMLVVTPDSTMDRQHLIHLLESTDPLDFDAKREEWSQTGHSGTMTATGAALGGVTATTTTTAVPATGYASAPAATAATAGDDTIKVMEERLRVGKREVAAGAVRIRSYIVERPIEEQVRLREERVSVERRPVDRPATGADLGAFQERTIEARATSEEAVVSKDARVVEEIALNKQATERVETIHETVRKTEVEVEGADSAATTGTLPGKVGVNPNATPGATTSGANSPLK